MNRKLLCLMLLLCLGLVRTVAAQELAGEDLATKNKIQFNRDIRPILSDNCFACHGPDPSHREADLRLDVRESALEERGGYQAITPAKALDSEVIKRILSTDEDLRMPPGEHGKRLTKPELESLIAWINQGAVYQKHWSITPVVRPELPKPHAGKDHAAIDAFILKRLQEEGLTFSPTADPRVLVRRLSFDLTGLPPAVEMVEEFAKNPTAKAYQQLVDQLLASEHYGERMAIYWLDLVRYADTLGYHGDQVRSVSPYRDYVIRAFNQNMPFDQFTKEQIAGDLLPEASLSQKVASTYNRLNRASGEGGVQPKEYLAKYAADRVRTTGNVWLGSTFGCAECHDHKFDEFTTKDFYSFAAFFADIKEQGIVSGARYIEQLPVPTTTQQQKIESLTQQITKLEHQYGSKTPEIKSAFDSWYNGLAQESNRWKLLTPQEATSTAGATLTIDDSGAITASGKAVDKDTYQLSFDSPLSSVAGLKIELLSDKAFPASGPGRASNGNFVLHQVNAKLGDQKIQWSKAMATHSQQGHSPDYIVSKQKNGWAILPQTGRDHQLILVAKQAAQRKAEGNTLSIDLVHNYGTNHTLAKFRVYACADLGENGKLVSPAILELAGTPKDQLTAAQQNELWENFRQQSKMLKPVREELTKLKAEKAAIEKSIVTTLATSATKPRMMRILPRGNWMDDSGEVVTPAVPQFLATEEFTNRSLNRLDLANWLTSKENPLVARTFVNRLWMLYFGNGLSRNVDDLGSQGEPPTHPELLDYLASELIDSGWDVKHMVRLMVTTQAYQQSSVASEKLRNLDPENRLLARQSRWRLDAEMVRDNALAVSGLLIKTIGGVSAKPYQPAGYWAQLNFPKRRYQQDANENQYRRGLYTHWQRTFLHPSLLAFDAPAREECTAQRERSNTPLQALVLLNDPTYVEAARVFAERIINHPAADFEAKLTFAFQTALSRKPKTAEVQLMQSWYESNLARYQKDTAAADKLLKTGLAPIDQKIDPVKLAAWTSVTRGLLNLHEGITRY